MLGKLMIEDQVKRGRIKILGIPTPVPGEPGPLGAAWHDVTLDLKWHAIQFKLQPGLAWRGVTNEHLELSSHFCARLEPMHDRTLQGLFVYPRLLGPSYSGRIEFVIKNVGTEPAYLVPDMRIAALTFETVIGGDPEWETLPSVSRSSKEPASKTGRTLRLVA